MGIALAKRLFLVLAVAWVATGCAAPNPTRRLDYGRIPPVRTEQVEECLVEIEDSWDTRTPVMPGPVVFDPNNPEGLEVIFPLDRSFFKVLGNRRAGVTGVAPYRPSVWVGEPAGSFTVTESWKVQHPITVVELTAYDARMQEQAQALFAFDALGKEVPVPAEVRDRIMNAANVSFAITGCTRNPANRFLTVRGTLSGPEHAKFRVVLNNNQAQVIPANSSWEITLEPVPGYEVCRAVLSGVAENKIDAAVQNRVVLNPQCDPVIKNRGESRATKAPTTGVGDLVGVEY